MFCICSRICTVVRSKGGCRNRQVKVSLQKYNYVQKASDLQENMLSEDLQGATRDTTPQKAWTKLRTELRQMIHAKKKENL